MEQGTRKEEWRSEGNFQCSIFNVQVSEGCPWTMDRILNVNFNYLDSGGV